MREPHPPLPPWQITPPRAGALPEHQRSGITRRKSGWAGIARVSGAPDTRAIPATSRAGGRKRSRPAPAGSRPALGVAPASRRREQPRKALHGETSGRRRSVAGSCTPPTGGLLLPAAVDTRPRIPCCCRENGEAKGENRTPGTALFRFMFAPPRGATCRHFSRYSARNRACNGRVDGGGIRGRRVFLPASAVCSTRDAIGARSRLNCEKLFQEAETPHPRRAAATVVATMPRTIPCRAAARRCRSAGRRRSPAAAW